MCDTDLQDINKIFISPKKLIYFMIFVPMKYKKSCMDSYIVVLQYKKKTDIFFIPNRQAIKHDVRGNSFVLKLSPHSSHTVTFMS